MTRYELLGRIMPILCLLLYPALLPADDYRLIYSVEGRETKDTVEWLTEETPEGFIFTTDHQGRQSRIECDGDHDGRGFWYRDSGTGTEIEATAGGGAVRVSGLLEGESLRKEVTIPDGIPWYQSFNHQFAGFALSAESRREFMMLRLDTFGASRWQLKRLGTESAESPSGPVAAVRIRVSLTGLMAPLWNAELVYRLTDGRFLRYEGLAGGPGSERIVMQLEREERLTPQ